MQSAQLPWRNRSRNSYGCRGFRARRRQLPPPCWRHSCRFCCRCNFYCRWNLCEKIQVSKAYVLYSKINLDKKRKLEEIENKNMCALSQSTVCVFKFQQSFLCTIFLQAAFMFTRNFLIQLIPMSTLSFDKI